MGAFKGRSMICRRCGKEVEKGWRFCPNCGSVIQKAGKSLFDEIFSRFRKEFEDTDNAFEDLDKEFGMLDLSPFLRKHKGSPKSKGFTIKITRRNNEQPKVDVQTFGNVDKNYVRKEVSEDLEEMGFRSQEGRPFPEPAHRAPAGKHRVAMESGESSKDESKFSEAKETKEPDAKVRTEGTSLVVEMDLEDVKSIDDVEVKELESSVEVRARAGDKAYFKIIRKPEQFSVSSRRLEKGRLFLEFS